MPLPISPSFLSLCGDLLVATVVIGGLIRGFRTGLFRGVGAGIVAVAALILPLALAAPLADWFVRMNIPRRLALGASHSLLLVVLVGGMLRLAAMIPGRALRLPPVLDAIGGGAVGAVTAGMVAGTALVAWSILPVPAPLRIDPSSMRLDAGTAALTVFARCAAADPQARALLLEGEPRGAGRASGSRRASETFVDVDGDGRHDDDEEYLDADGNHAFSPRVLFRDVDADGRRDIGLLERYRLGRWDRVTVLPDESDGPPTGDDGAGPGVAPVVRPPTADDPS